MKNLNDWNQREVKRAETTWGHTFPQYTTDMFTFAFEGGNSYLDLGCGFGRFLEFLLDNCSEPDYIGYDSSPDMIERIKERFPEYSLRIFEKDPTKSITHSKYSIILSAVFVHITIEDQVKILNNILALQPKPSAITFDINSPPEREIDRLKIQQSESYERFIRTTRDGTATFRMTWQSHYAMTARILKMFPEFDLSINFYDLRQNRHKVVYMISKRS